MKTKKKLLVKPPRSKAVAPYTTGIFAILHKNGEAVDRADYPKFHKDTGDKSDH